MRNVSGPLIPPLLRKMLLLAATALAFVVHEQLRPLSSHGRPRLRSVRCGAAAELCELRFGCTRAEALLVEQKAVAPAEEEAVVTLSVAQQRADTLQERLGLSEAQLKKVVTTGTSSTSYSPAGLVTREQMGVALGRFFETVTGTECGGAHPFVDVAESSFAFDSVGCIYGLGVTTGTSSTSYAPGESVTREQMAAFLERLYNAVTS